MRLAHSWRSLVRCSRRCATSCGSSWSSSWWSIDGKSCGHVPAHVVLGHRRPSCQPLGHGHRGAAAHLGRDLELVHQPAGAREARGPGRRRCCSRRPAPARRRRCRARCRGPPRWMPGRGSSSSSTVTSPRAGEPDDVAGHLRDRGGDQRQVGAGEAEPWPPARARPAARPRCPRRRGSGSAPRRRAAGRAPAAAGSARAHSSHSSRCRAASDLPLAAPVAAGQREQHRPAPVGRRLDLLEGQQVLDPQPGPGAVQLGGHGTRACEPSSLGQRPGVLAGDLVGQQGLALPLGRGGSAPRPTAALLLLRRAGPRPALGAGRRSTTRCWLRRCRSFSAPHRGDHVARRHDGVRLEHPRLDPARPRPGRAPASPARGPRRPAGRPPGPPTIRRSIGIRAATSASSAGAPGAGPAVGSTLMARTVLPSRVMSVR